MDTQTYQMEQLIGRSIPFDKSEEDGSPLYFQLAKAIRQQIEKGSLTAGELIPSERKIATYNNLSIATVRKALEELAQRGFLTRVHGKGTYVAGTADRRKKIRYYPFVEGFNDDLAQSDIKFVELKIIKGQAWLNEQLKTRKNQDLYELKRIITQFDKPIVYCVSYLPRKMFKGLEECGRVDFETEPLYLFLEEKFGVTTTKHIELLSATLSDEETAGPLNVEIGLPMLRIDKLVFTHKGKPYECRISHCLVDERKMRRII